MPGSHPKRGSSGTGTSPALRSSPSRYIGTLAPFHINRLTAKCWASRSFLLDGGAGRKSHHLWDNLGRLIVEVSACLSSDTLQDNFISESWLRS
jgi:hypothetical protein